MILYVYFSHHFLCSFQIRLFSFGLVLTTLQMEAVEKVFKLEAEEELRVEVDCGKTDKVTVELKTGHAEIFGTELVINTK